MKKTNVLKIFEIIVLLFSLSIIFSSKVQASEASLSVTGGSNGKINVTINIPSDIAGYDGSISITYSDGSTKFLRNITPLPKFDSSGNLAYVGNYQESIEIDSNKTGLATVIVENFNMYSINDTNSGNNSISASNSNHVLRQSVNISNGNSSPSSTSAQNNSGTGASSSPGASSASTPASTSNSGSGTTSTPSAPAAPVTLNFKDTNEKMYVTRRVNVRQSYGTDSGIIQTLAVGTEVTRTGISDGTKNGYSWSRISYNGITGYLITGALTYDAPKIDENPENQVVNNVVENKVNEVSNEISNEVVNNAILNEVDEISNKLGTIPEVGINIMPFIFVGSCVSCVVLVIDVKRKISR